eukprot:TRINITY_DN9463_c0_g1_i25.p1 TRINITY_DN9463_c0_g1~~TRINITY_DN9463_c0_g1_i25.p1  ORF type:complete len:319 (-),score=67.24 TRINITY_DN9463_c0_g1_i25:40-996(-)
MNINSLPRCIIGKLPSLSNIPLPELFAPSSPTFSFNCICPSPNGAFKPVSAASASAGCVVNVSEPLQPALAPARPDTLPGSLRPFNGKRKLSSSNEEEEGKSKGEKTVEDRKAKRAEKNRKFAKESRDRKRKYIQDLEAEVKHLREQLEVHKQRLRKYELLEKHGNSLGKEVYNMVVSVYREMNEFKQPLSNHSIFIETFKKKIDEAFEEQRCIITQLSKVMMNIMLPLPLRISVWLSEKQIDLYDCEKALDKLGSEIPTEHIKMLVCYMREVYPDKKKYSEMLINLADTGNKIKSLMKLIIEPVSYTHLTLPTTPYV